MNTIRIYLTESGRIADLQKDFPLYQGQFQNKLLNVFVPTSILAPMFTSSGAVSADYVASTSTKIGMTYTARDGSIKTSKNYYMRYLKTLMYKGVEYALYERKLPKEFTFYAGQGENSPVLIINVVNIEQQSGDTPPLVLSVITSQTCHLDVMQSTFLDRDELNEPSELENLNAQVQALNAIMPLKQDKEDNNIDLKQKPVQKTVVGAINDLGELVETAQTAADANKAEIGDLSALTTDEKATLVGAINEVDNHADNATTLANNAVATANSAVATANEAKTTAQTAETNANNAVDKATEAQRKAQEAITKAENNVYAVGFMTLQEAITAVNGYDNTVLKTNDNILVVAQGSPDLYVTSVEATNIPYNFTTVDKFNDDLVKNTVLQIGYYKVAFYETDGQPVTVAYQNVVVKSTDWVASTEFADFPYEAKIPLSNFVDYKTVPQVVFDIADTMSGNYAPICKSGDKCVYIYGKVQNEITLKTVITFAPNVNGASVVGGGYNNRGKWVASTTYAIDDLVYTDNGQYVCIEGITSTTSPEQDTTHWQATFVATGKTKNTLTISGQDNGTGVQKTFDGSQAVEVAFDENTMTAKEVNGVLKVGAKGTVPEALPQEASAVKSGNLPTTGWVAEIANIVTTTAYLSSSEMTIIAHIDANIAKLKTGWEITLTGDYFSGTYYNQYSSGQKRIVYNYDITGGKSYTMTDEYGNARFHLEIYDNGEIKMSADDRNSEGTYGISIKNTTYSQWVLSISDTSITANSDILMELTDEGGVKANALASGSIQVIRDTVPTQPIPYTYKVKQTNASGQFTLVNHFVPNIPDSPTSLPVTYKKVSGSLPTSGWTTLDEGWKDSTMPVNRDWFGVTYGNGKFVVVVHNSAYGAYSTDGINWTETNLPANMSWQSVTYGNGKYVAVAQNNGYGAYSTDGINWTGFTLPARDWRSVTYGDGKYVAIAGNTEYGAYSLDGINWTDFTLPASYNWNSVTYGNGKFVVVTYNNNKGIYSTDGITWTEMTMPASRYWQSVTYGNGKFVAVASDSANGAYSLDGINWTETTMPANRRWRGVTYGDGKYVAVADGSANKGAYSTDGINWAEFTMPANRNWANVTYGNGKFVAVAYGSAYGAYWKAAAQVTYSISDTDITANTAVKMYLTDEGGVKAYSKANGSITVIRDEVPTTAIPYEYEVEQTSAEGLFEVINAYVPTKTSELTNDSGFVKTSEANTFTAVQTFSNADGIKTDRVHNLDNNDAWYNFDGANNRFGSPSRPTIIRTSEARPRAQVPSGETTVTKEIALLEDVQGSEWAVNNDNTAFPKNGWYLISNMVVENYQLAPFIARVTAQNNKLVVVAQDLEGHDVTLAMTIGGDRKFADAIRAHTYTIANNAVTATSTSLSITTLLTDGQFSFDYKLLY